MRLQITHLKAPWPAGAVVGDVLDLPAVPAWAVGKCTHVGDDVELTIVDNSDYVAPVTEDDEEAKIAAALAEAEKQHAEELAAIEAAKPAEEAPKRKAK